MQPTPTTTETRRKKRLVLAAAVAVTVLLSACFPPVPQPSGHAESSSELVAAELLWQVNQERAARGLPGLRWDPDLAGVAWNWSFVMSETGSFQHRNLGSLFQLAPFSYRHSALGENILRGPASITAGSMTTAWMNSTGHRHNILSPGFDSIGIGVVCRNGLVYVTQNFGRHISSRKSLSTNAGPSPIVAQSGKGHRC